MELKDVILSTLEELEHSTEQVSEPVIENSVQSLQEESVQDSASLSSNHNERAFLKNIKERSHVLFEGFQSPNNVHIEAKVDLTLNFLEYLLASIETRLNEIKEEK